MLSRSTLLRAALLLLAAALAAPLHAGNGVWTPLGPYGGTVSSLTSDPRDPRVLYANLECKLFRSADGGATWKRLALPCVSSNVAAAPTRPTTLYVTSSVDGRLWKSLDGGEHWAPGAATLWSYGVPQVLAVDPSQPSHLYLGTWKNGVWKSTDRGASWTAVNRGLPARAQSTVVALAVHPRTPGTVYAGTPGNGVFKTTNGGASWQPSSQGLPHAATVSAVAVAPSDPRVVYAALYWGIFKSTDAGATWRAIGLAEPRILSLAVDPGSPGVVSVGTEGRGVFRTTDGGASWTATNFLAATRVPAVVAPAPGAVYAGLAASERLFPWGVYRSLDGGRRWTAVNQGLTGLAVTVAAVDPEGGLWAGLTTPGVARSFDGGRTWSSVTDLGLRISAFSFLAASPPGVVAASYAGGSVFRSTDRGATWSESSSPVHGATRLIASPDDPSTLYVAGYHGVAKSVDGGESWTRTPAGFVLLDLVIAPSSPSTLYAAGLAENVNPRFPPDAVLWKSLDRGASWTRVDAGIPGERVSAVAVDPEDPTVVYAGLGGGIGPPIRPAGIWKSTDGGATWVQAAGLRGRLIDALLHTAVPGRLYAVVEGKVARSDDGAATWHSLPRGLTGRVLALSFDPAEPRRLYAATTEGVQTWTEPPF